MSEIFSICTIYKTWPIYEAARQYIQEASWRRCCGFRGVLRRQDFSPEVIAAITAVIPPRLLQPIATTQGVQLILVDEVIQPELDDTRREEIVKTLFTEWLERQMAELDLQVQLGASCLPSRK